METIIVRPETQEKSDALEAVLKALNIDYEKEIDTTEYLLSTEANKEALKKSITEVNEGKTTKVNLDEIWK